MTTGDNPWDDYATEYADWIDRREPARIEGVQSRLLETLGEPSGREVLDACCGEGYLARVLTARGARVTGIDLSPRLIEVAHGKDPSGSITYRVADLSRPLPDLVGRFDLIGSFLALDDVSDYRGFATTLASLARPGARVALAFNNPYSMVVRTHVKDYFASGTLGQYRGLAAQGIRVHHCHRTLEEYVDAFLSAGLRLIKLADVRDSLGREWLLPPDCRFPIFMVLGFDKP